MARRTIVKIGEDILRKRAKEVTVFDNGLAALLDDMIETMTAADGIGLAGPQVGVLKRVAVISPDGKNFYEFVNPVIEKSSGMQKCREGCLSVPGVSGEVMRPKKVVVRAYDRYGNEFVLRAEGFLADICCHEFDHLDGVLFIDKLIKKEK